MRKIRYLKNEDINKAKWDACVTHAFNGNTYAYSWYLDIIHPGWCALVEEDYLRIMPLPVKQKYGVTFCYQPFFAQQLGVFSVSLLTPDIVTDFLRQIPPFVKLINLNLNSLSIPDTHLFPVEKRANYLLDLIHDPAHLETKYNSNTRRNLKAAQKSGLSMIKSLNHEEIIHLFRNNRGKEVAHWGDEQYQVLSRLMYTAIYQGHGITYGVYNGFNELVSGAFFLRNNHKLIFLFSGTSEEGRSTSALTFLIHSVISDHAPSKLILDFEGSNDANLARYYGGFGATRTDYYQLKINRFSPVGNLLFKLASRFVR